MQQVEKEEDQRSPTGIRRVLDQVEGRPAIGPHSAKFPIEVGVPRG
jgi:hypothetical protein